MSGVSACIREAREIENVCYCGCTMFLAKCVGAIISPKIETILKFETKYYKVHQLGLEILDLISEWLGLSFLHGKTFKFCVRCQSAGKRRLIFKKIPQLLISECVSFGI